MSSSLFEISEKNSILASSGSFTVKIDSIHSFFVVLGANLEFASFAPRQKYTGWTVSMEMVRVKVLTEKGPIRAQGFAKDWVCHNYNNS